MCFVWLRAGAPYMELEMDIRRDPEFTGAAKLAGMEADPT